MTTVVCYLEATWDWLQNQVHADFPAGVPDQIKRAVSENANSLGLKTKDWE